MKVSAGNWKMYIWEGGSPVWCELFYEGERIAKVSHQEISDLKYVMERTVQIARRRLPDKYKEEV